MLPVCKHDHLFHPQFGRRMPDYLGLFHVSWVQLRRFNFKKRSRKFQAILHVLLQAQKLHLRNNFNDVSSWRRHPALLGLQNEEGRERF